MCAGPQTKTYMFQKELYSSRYVKTHLIIANEDDRCCKGWLPYFIEDFWQINDCEYSEFCDFLVATCPSIPKKYTIFCSKVLIAWTTLGRFCCSWKIHAANSYVHTHQDDLSLIYHDCNLWQFSINHFWAVCKIMLNTTRTNLFCR